MAYLHVIIMSSFKSHKSSLYYLGHVYENNKMSCCTTTDFHNGYLMELNLILTHFHYGYFIELKGNLPIHFHQQNFLKFGL